MRQIYLQKQFYQLAKQSTIRLNEQANTRLETIKTWEARRGQGLKAVTALEILDLFRATLYRWQQRL